MNTTMIEVPDGDCGPELWAVWDPTRARCDLVGLATAEGERDRTKRNAADLHPPGTPLAVMEERVPLNHLYGHRNAVKAWHRKTLRSPPSD